MKNDLDALESEIPRGAFWMTGKFMRRVIQAIRRERRYAALNGGISEQPTKDGYAMSSGAGAGRAVTTYYIRNGVLVTYEVSTLSGPTTV